MRDMGPGAVATLLATTVTESLRSVDPFGAMGPVYSMRHGATSVKRGQCSPKGQSSEARSVTSFFVSHGFHGKIRGRDVSFDCFAENDARGIHGSIHSVHAMRCTNEVSKIREVPSSLL